MMTNMVMFDRLPWFSESDLLKDTRGTVGHLQANPEFWRKQFLKGEKRFWAYISGPTTGMISGPTTGMPAQRVSTRP
ncbi:MAG: hypothetical protein JJ897_03820 [Marinibacterium sp.]|nr:hypothetical protein [Marinibacterium sp.]